MTHERDRRVTITALRVAVPYLRLFQRKIFVIKAGGQVVADPPRAQALMEQVGILHQLGIRVVVVHGGGEEATSLATRLGVETRFVAGRRVTDEPGRDVAVMTFNGTVNTRMVAVCRELGVPACGLSGIDAGLIEVHRRPPVEVEGEGEVDYGWVGDIHAVRTGILERLLDDGFVPVISPLSASAEGEVLNVNADVVAARLAREMGAEKLILVTGAPGVLEDPDDPSSLVSYTDIKGLDALRSDGSLARGMLPKAAAIRDALEGGVPRVHVISYREPDSLLFEIFTNEGSGTLVVLDTQTLRPEET